VTSTLSPVGVAIAPVPGVSRSRLSALVVAMTMTAPLVCQAQSVPGFRPAGQTARVRFFSRTSAKVDRRQAERTDSFIARIENDLGHELPEPIEYYRYERPEDIAAQTGVYATGLTRVGDTIVHSTFDYHPHELVHAVAGRLGNPGRFFHEGLAVALGDGGKWGGRSVHDIASRWARSLDWAALREVFERRDPDVAYPLAGSFMADLIATDGLPRLAAFLRACPRPTAAIDAFQRVYGRSLEEAVAQWQEGLAPGREAFPSGGNDARVASAAAGVGGPRNTLADLVLEPAAGRGTVDASR
jgi:hypothetical protein